MLITVQQIMGNNFEFIQETLNNCFNTYKTIINVSPNLQSYVDLIAAKLKVKIKVIKNFESLYDLDTSRDMFIDLVNDMFPEFITNSIVNGLMMNSDWLDFNNLGKVKGSNEMIQNYTGFSVVNQDGQFTKNSNNSQQSGGITKLQYITYLQSYIDEKISKFLYIFKANVLKLIY